ncbi:hypothetical protein B0H34DRAFT_720219 [Crassisporium funariophilum]|nr:hypothetical protein B0H34DRAFT_720219 [Crassisporium funariophilum]
MDSGAHKLLESATQRTLHAHAFSRSSTQASSVLTDLLSRYLALLTSTCAKYAQHAGRRNLTLQDAIGALDELGVNLHDLTDYCTSEGKELNRYALYSARRVEDLHEFKSQLSDGLRLDHDDAIPLQYARCPSPLLQSLDDDDDQASDEEEEIENDDEALFDTQPDTDYMDEDMPPLRADTIHRKRPPSRPTTPDFPLSPISNSSSPLRKRPRISNWEPPEHIPSFLPPFPSVSDDVPASPFDHTSTDHIEQSMKLPPTQATQVKIEKVPETLSQPLTTSAVSDILVQVPYDQSSLASVSQWHLPSALPPAPPNRQSRLPTPQIGPALLQAYHHILTHPPPPDPPPLNPSRHKVVMALLKQSEANPRWNPADSLFASVKPCPPRVATIGPSYPVAIGETPSADLKGKGDAKDKDVKLPPVISRAVAVSEQIAPFISQQSSRIPDLARHILPPAILARTSRLSHPPVLYRGTKPLVYGTGIPAPWNANALPSADAVPPTPLTAKPKDPAVTNGKDSPVKAAIPDARLYATWDYETKDFKVPLASLARGRGRIGSIQASGSGMISLPATSRTKGTK